MKSYSVYYVKDKTIDDMERIAGGEKKLRLAFGLVHAHTGSPWLECGYHKDSSPPHDEALMGEASIILEKSKTYGEMIFLFADKADMFYYEHALDGVLLRRLSWLPFLDDFGTPGWIAVQGNPEQWESELFFTEKKLEWTIKEARDFLCFEKDFETIFAAREKEIHELWEKGVITAGNTLPKCDWTVAQVVEKAFGLKHQEDPWKSG